jgi:predicted transcriptional regulator
LTDIPQSEYVDNFKEDDEIAMEADLESLYVTNPALAEEIELEQFNKDA